MPRLSDSMEEGTIIRWCKSDGDVISAGDELVEIETDKATVSYEAELAGLLRIVAAEGQALPVGAVIAEIGGSAQASPHAVSPPSNGATHSARAKASPVARRLAERLEVELSAIRGTGPSGRIVKRFSRSAHSRSPSSARRRGDRLLPDERDLDLRSPNPLRSRCRGVPPGRARRTRATAAAGAMTGKKV